MNRRIQLAALSLAAVVTAARLVITAFTYGIPAWFDEELNPLVNLLTRGQAISQIDARQYGVVVFFVFDPAVRLLGANWQGLATYASIVSLVCLAAAFALVARRYATTGLRGTLVLAIAWCTSVPLLYVVAQHMVDAWQLLFLSASLVLFTGSPRQRRFAGVPLALATLTKLLPGLLLVYLCIRQPRAGLIGLACIAVLLGIGQLVYGSLMGFGYPLAMLSTGGDTVARWSTHFENNSLRGLIFKLAAGFRLQPYSAAYLLSPQLVPALSALAYAIAALLIGLLLVVAWRGRGQDSTERRSLEFGLAIVTMLLVSPHTAQDYLVVVLPVLSIWLWLWARRWPFVWPRTLSALAALSAVLIGVFVPMTLAARLLPIGWLLETTHNAQNALFADQIGSAIGAYEFFGLPGLGLLLAWLTLVALETHSTEAVLSPQPSVLSPAI